VTPEFKQERTMTDVPGMTTTPSLILATFLTSSLVAALTYWLAHRTIPKSRRYPLLKLLITGVVTLTLAVAIGPWFAATFDVMLHKLLEIPDG